MIGVVGVDGIGDQQHRPVSVIQHGEICRQEEAQLGDRQLVRIRIRESLPPTHRVIGEIAHHASRERGQPRGSIGPQEGHRVPKRFQGITPLRDIVGWCAPPTRHTIRLREHGCAPGTDKREAGVRATLLGRLQEEGARTLLRELAIQAHRRLAIGKESSHNRDHPSTRSQLPESVKIRSNPPGSREGKAPGDGLPHSTSSESRSSESGSSESMGTKHVREPV